MYKEGQSLPIEREKGKCRRGAAGAAPGPTFFVFWGDENSWNPARVPGIVRLEEIGGVVLVDEGTRVSGR